MSSERSYAKATIRPEMTVRQIAVDFPSSQEIFRRYGEPDRPGQFGHLEPLTHLARRRGLALEKLMAELAEVTGVPVESSGAYADRIHRPFLLSALAITLSLGAGWGAWLLWRIGATRDFLAVPAGHVIAHGEAQLWGFIALFILGIAARTVLQPAIRRPLGRLASGLVLAATLAGISGGFAWFLLPDALPALGIASAASLVVAATVFWGLELVVLLPKWPATWTRAVMIAGGWLVAWSVVTFVLRRAAGVAGPEGYTSAQRLLIIELAVFGFAMNAIYGFGQMLLPGFLRTGAPRRWALELALGLHNVGAILLCITTAWSWPGGLAVTGAVLVAAAAVCYAIGQRFFVGKPRQSQRAEQGHWLLDYYMPLAFFWLIASLLLLSLGHGQAAVSGQPLPHAFVGAVRHALTVGFMTTLILGVGQRLLPVLEHTVLRFPGLVAPILLLIGLGNVWRVGSELAALATPAAFPLMPLSAVLEWTALALFAVNAVATMCRTDPLLARGRVTPGSSLAVLLAEHPSIEDHLIAAGFRYLARTRSVPHELTIGAFATSEGRDAEGLVKEINGLLAQRR